MHLLTLRAPLEIGKTVGKIAAGDYLIHDINAFEFASRAPRTTASVRDSGWEKLLQPEAKNTLIMRSGAYGDLLRLTPVLRAWKEKTGHKVSLSCFTHRHSLFANSDLVDELLPYPLPLAEVSRFSEVISLEDTVELDHEHHISDVFAKAMGVATPLQDYKPVYIVSAAERVKALPHLFAGRPTIGVQVRASVANRNYPWAAWVEIIVRLERQGWGVVIFGRKGELPPFPPQLQTPFIRDLSLLDLPLRESVAVLAGCRAMIGIDSSFLHFAAALDIPAIGLFGPFKWQTRVGRDPLTDAIMGTGPCAGCSWHMTGLREFPPNMPCTQKQQCVVLETIHPSRIVTKAELLKP